MAKRTIKVDYLARVEGEGGMKVRIVDGVVRDVQMKIFEPPRFFEAFLRGRDYSEAPDITARICGICPVAYQMSAVHAMEDALGVITSPTVRLLRRLLYCGEWIESHALHIYMLHAPDFLGFESAVHLAQASAANKALVKRGLRLKKAGNSIVDVLAGRSVHPINVRVGGFYKLPARADFAALREELVWARDAARETVHWAASLPCPDFEQDYEFVALHHPTEYPMNEGRVVGSSGLDIEVAAYSEHFVEQHVAHSNALQATMKGVGSYLVGPMARYEHCFAQLPDEVAEVARSVGAEPPVRNPFRSIVVRSLEVFYAVIEALRIVDTYAPEGEPAAPIDVRAGVGHSCTEAPRGALYHRYELDAEGTILDARIVPPTSQNQTRIEEDLRAFVERHVALDDKALTWQCEQAIRNYDPCISCATHFLKLEVERS